MRVGKRRLTAGGIVEEGDSVLFATNRNGLIAELRRTEQFRSAFATPFRGRINLYHMPVAVPSIRDHFRKQRLHSNPRKEPTEVTDGSYLIRKQEHRTPIPEQVILGSPKKKATSIPLTPITTIEHDFRLSFDPSQTPPWLS